ncbi:hypothetical protein TI06_23635, partial [Vibrio vulnificus]
EHQDLRRDVLQQASAQPAVAIEDHAGIQAVQAQRQHRRQLAFAGLLAPPLDPPLVILDPAQGDQGVVVASPPVEPL